MKTFLKICRLTEVKNCPWSKEKKYTMLTKLLRAHINYRYNTQTDF